MTEKNFRMIKFKDFCLFFERGEGREEEGERNIDVPSVASHVPPTRDLALNPGMCPDRESNWQA